PSFPFAGANAPQLGLKKNREPDTRNRSIPAEANPSSLAPGRYMPVFELLLNEYIGADAVPSTAPSGTRGVIEVPLIKNLFSPRCANEMSPPAVRYMPVLVALWNENDGK